MLTILNIKSRGLCAPGYVFRVTWWHLVVLYDALKRSIAAIIKTSIHRGSKVDMGGGVYFCSEAGRAESPTPLSSGAVVLVFLVPRGTDGTGSASADSPCYSLRVL